MNIIIGMGMDSALFGASQSDIMQALGPPDKINKTEREHCVIFYYNEIMTKCIFNLKEQNRLMSIETFHVDACLFNQRIMGKSKEEVECFLRQNGISDIEHDDYDTFDTIFCIEIWTTFQFEFNRLMGIEFSVLLNDDDTIKWPMQKLGSTT